jgi:hypothetical protein
MKPTPRYDTEATLNAICSREDFRYKKSLRNNMAPIFVPETGKYDVGALECSHRARKPEKKAKVQMTELEMKIKRLEKDQQQKRIQGRMERIVQNQDRFARLTEKENLRNLPCINNMAEKRLFFDSHERNKLAELNYLLHRKQDYTPERENSKGSRNSGSGRNSGFKSGFKKDRKSPSSKQKRTESTENIDQTHSGLPFLIGDIKAEDELVFEGIEDDQAKSKQIEVINYPQPNMGEGFSTEDLIALIKSMEQEIKDLNKDLAEANKPREVQDEKLPPKSLLIKIKNFLIRSLWDLGDLKNDLAEKDRRIANLIDIIKRFDPSLAKQIARVDGETGSKLYERSSENENLLRLVEGLIESCDKEEKDFGPHSSRRLQPSSAQEFDRLTDQIESAKAENCILNDFFKKFRSYDDSIVKLNNKQLLEKGAQLSIELLLRSLDKQTSELVEKEGLLNRQQEDLVNLHKKLGQLEGIMATQREAFQRETLSVLQLLYVGQERELEVLTDEHEVVKAIREKITTLKLQNEEATSKVKVLSQMEKVKEDEIKDLRGKLLAQSHLAETNSLERAQLEERLRFSEIEKNNLHDLQFRTEEELRRLKAESKQTADDLTDKVKAFSQKLAEQEKTIQSESSQPSKGASKAAVDTEALEATLNQLCVAAYRQDMPSAFDTDLRGYVESRLGPNNTASLLAFDDYLGQFKYRANLAESVYQEKVVCC